MEARAMDLGAATPRASAVVADRRPLERALVVFLLEEQGVRVAAEADSMSDVFSMVELHTPDVVVIHERLALGDRPARLARIRRISPDTEVVVFAATSEDVPPALVLAADGVVEDAAALTDLARSIASRRGNPPDSVVEEWHRGELAESGPSRPPSGSGSRGRWVNRLQGVLAATTFVALLLVVRGAMPIVTAPPEAREHLVAAYDVFERLDEIATATASTPEAVSAFAQRLLLERNLALIAGADVSDLDQRIKRLVLRLVPSLPEAAASSLVRTLGSLFTEHETASLRSLEGLWLAPSPSPDVEASDPPVIAPPPIDEPTDTGQTPGEDPGPTPSEDPVPTPTEDPVPTPTEDPDPTSSEDPSPTPSEDPSPTPSEDPSPTPSPTASGEPSTASEQPGSLSEDPGTASEDPATAPEEPATAIEEPAAAPEEPATASEESVTAPEEPSPPADDPSIAA